MSPLKIDLDLSLRASCAYDILAGLQIRPPTLRSCQIFTFKSWDQAYVAIERNSLIHVICGRIATNLPWGSMHEGEYAQLRAPRRLEFSGVVIEGGMRLLPGAVLLCELSAENNPPTRSGRWMQTGYEKRPKGIRLKSLIPTTQLPQTIGYEYVEVGPGGGIPAHTHKHSSSIVLVVQGRGWCGCDNEIFEVSPGSLLHIPKGMRHGFKAGFSSGLFKFVSIQSEPIKDDYNFGVVEYEYPDEKEGAWL